MKTLACGVCARNMQNASSPCCCSTCACYAATRASACAQQAGTLPLAAAYYTGRRIADWDARSRFIVYAKDEQARTWVLLQQPRADTPWTLDAHLPGYLRRLFSPQSLRNIPKVVADDWRFKFEYAANWLNKLRPGHDPATPPKNSKPRCYFIAHQFDFQDLRDAVLRNNANASAKLVGIFPLSQIHETTPDGQFDVKQKWQQRLAPDAEYTNPTQDLSLPAAADLHHFLSDTDAGVHVDGFSYRCMYTTIPNARAEMYVPPDNTYLLD